MLTQYEAYAYFEEYLDARNNYLKDRWRAKISHILTDGHSSTDDIYQVARENYELVLNDYAQSLGVSYEEFVKNMEELRKNLGE